MQQTHWNAATHAVVGKSKDHGQGVIGLFDNEFWAYKMKKEIKRSGGDAKICDVEDGELSDEDNKLKNFMMGLTV